MLRASTLLSSSALFILITTSLTGNSVSGPPPKHPAPPASQVTPQRAAALRKIDQWLNLHHCADVVFDDAAAFFNANTLEELRRLENGPSA